MNNPDNLLGAAAGGHQVEVLGRLWTFSPIGPAIRSRFGLHFQCIARQRIARERSYVGEDVYRESMAALNAAITAGDYHWRSPTKMGKTIREILLSENGDGQLKLMQMLLEDKHGEVSEEDIQEMLEAENRDEVVWVLKGAMGTRDPNEKRPVKKKPASQEERQEMTATSPSAT